MNEDAPASALVRARASCYSGHCRFTPTIRPNARAAETAITPQHASGVMTEMCQLYTVPAYVLSCDWFTRGTGPRMYMAQQSGAARARAAYCFGTGVSTIPNATPGFTTVPPIASNGSSAGASATLSSLTTEKQIVPFTSPTLEANSTLLV